MQRGIFKFRYNSIKFSRRVYRYIFYILFYILAGVMSYINGSENWKQYKNVKIFFPT